MPKTRYVIALGSNRYRGGPPSRIIERAYAALARYDVRILQHSQNLTSRAVGPGTRNFANAAAQIETKLSPPELLSTCKRIEMLFGRRRGQRWGDRHLDIDIILWSGGLWADENLTIPHRAFRERLFVLNPLVEIAPDWRDPITGLSIRHLKHRLNRAVPVDPARQHP